MPYIPQERRAALNDWLSTPKAQRAKDAGPLNAGELNFCLTALLITGATMPEDFEAVMLAYLHSEPIRYQRINDVIGAAECAVLEADARAPGSYKFGMLMLVQVARVLYAKIARPYEDAKRIENGDIRY